MHQDAYSAYATPGIGDGAPAWADLGGDMSDDFQAFWDDTPAPDGAPIQTHFIGGLERLARSSLGTSANVFGYDPFNEPYAGTKSPCALFQPCPSFESGELADFYRRAIAGIRSVDARHMIFPEGIAQNGQAEPALPRFADPQTAFNFHYYCTATQANPNANAAEAAYCSRDEANGLGNFEQYADALGVPAILSEFGASAPTDDLQRVVLAAGQRFISWMQWAYENDFNDPSAPFTESNAAQAELDAIVVPYAQAIAGTPGSWSFDYASGTMKLTYTATAVPGARLAPGALTRIFVPERRYPTGYDVTATGAAIVSKPTAPWVQLTAPPGSQVSVTIKPRVGSYTLTPLQANSLPLTVPASCPAKRSVTINLGRVGGHVTTILVFINRRRIRIPRHGTRALRLQIPVSSSTTIRIVTLTSHARTVKQLRFPALPCHPPPRW
jgi:endoglycosylceramidase